MLDESKYTWKRCEPVWATLPCPIKNCTGEMKSVGYSEFNKHKSATEMFHRCTVCKHEDYASSEWPQLRWMPI